MQILHLLLLADIPPTPTYARPGEQCTQQAKVWWTTRGGVPQSHRDNFPLTRAKWNKAIAREFQMDLAVVSELRMHSLSYVCRRVDRNVGAIPVPVGVLIIESTLQTGATAEMQDILQDFKFWPLLTTECQAHMDAAKHRDGWV
jgi:hypothetical protein